MPLMAWKNVDAVYILFRVPVMNLHFHVILFPSFAKIFTGKWDVFHDASL